MHLAIIIHLFCVGYIICTSFKANHFLQTIDLICIDFKLIAFERLDYISSGKTKNRLLLILVLSIKNYLFKGCSTSIVLFFFYIFVLIGYLTNYIYYTKSSWLRYYLSMVFDKFSMRIEYRKQWVFVTSLVNSALYI